MKCQKIEKWLSDRLDGQLSERKKRILEDHLKGCASCRLYKGNITRIQEMSQSFKMLERSASYWEDFSSRLRRRLSALDSERKKAVFWPLRWRWTFVAAGAAALLLVIISFLLFLPQKSSVDESFVFSFEEAMAQLYFEIGDDTELENLLNSIILEDISDLVQDSPLLDDEVLFLESLTEEEAKYIEVEIKKEMKS